MTDGRYFSGRQILGQLKKHLRLQAMVDSANFVSGLLKFWAPSSFLPRPGAVKEMGTTCLFINDPSAHFRNIYRFYKFDNLSMSFLFPLNNRERTKQQFKETVEGNDQFHSDNFECLIQATGDVVF